MKRLKIIAGVVAVTGLVMLGAAGSSMAAQIFAGSGRDISLDASVIPAYLKPNLELMQKKCSLCHGLDLSFGSIQTGVTPSGVPFEKSGIQSLGVRMLRKPGSDMTTAELKKILELINWLREEITK